MNDSWDEPLNQIYCPLCLEALNASTGLYIWKGDTARPGRGSIIHIDCSSRNVAELLKENDSIPRSPLHRRYATHGGCTQLNPFYNSTQERIEFGVAQNARQNEAKLVNLELTHEMIGVLKAIQADVANSPELHIMKIYSMWFPVELLRISAINIEAPTGGRVVMQIGTQGVGKTVLAVEAASPSAFFNSKTKSDRVVKSTQFFYAPLPARFAFAIRCHMHQEMLNSKGPSPGWEGTHDTNETRSIFFSVPKRLNKGIAIRKFFTWNNDSNTAGEYKVLHFYDIAGEFVESKEPKVNLLCEMANNIAILFPATCLLPWDSNAPGKMTEMSFGAELNYAARLVNEYGRQEKKKVCVVITKVDEILHRVSPSLRDEIVLSASVRMDAEVDPDSGVPKEPKQPQAPRAAYEILKELVQIKIENDPWADVRLRLLREIGRLADVDIFFVWTEGLPTKNPPILKAEPQVPQNDPPKESAATSPPSERAIKLEHYGLENYIAWCFDKNNLSFLDNDPSKR